MYMAPEQARGETLDHRADLFSLGCVLYQMTSGRPPFRAATTIAVLKRVCDDAPRPITDIIPETPPWLCEITLRLMEKDREKRFQSAQTVADLFATCHQELTKHGDVTLVADPISPQHSKAKNGRGQSRSRKGIFAAMLFAIAALVLVPFIKPKLAHWGETRNEATSPDDNSEVVSATGHDGMTNVDSLSDPNYKHKLTSKSNSKLPHNTVDGVWGTVDLLPLIDVEEHSVRNGQWSLEGGVLKSPFVEQQYSLVEIPYYPPEEYDLTMLVERVSPVPEVLGIGLWVKDRYVVAVLDGWTGRASGLEVLDGHNASSNKTTVRRRFLGTNKKHLVTCRVRKNKVEVTVDENSVINWEGDVNRFSATMSQWRIPYSRNLFLGVNSVEYHFHQMTLTPVSPVRDPDKNGFEFRDPDLRAAEWALSLGGQVKYKLSGRRMAVQNAGQLPDTPFSLVEINLHGTTAEGWEFVALEGLQHLEKLTLPSRIVQFEKFVQSICCVSSLQELDLQSKVGTDEPLTYQKLSELRVALPDCVIKWKGGLNKPSSYFWPSDAPPPAIAPFDAAQAKAHQEAWANYLGFPVEKVIDIGGGHKLTMVLIPPGEFMMGQSASETERFWDDEIAQGGKPPSRIQSELPQHRVRITQPYYLSKYEVTQGQWDSVMRSSKEAKSETSLYPKVTLNWDEAQSFVSAMNEFHSGGNSTFSLPTEAEWEYACRAGTTTFWHCGNRERDLLQCDWIDVNSEGRIHPVGQLKPNAFGLYDLHGNAGEWCSDIYSLSYYSESNVNDPHGPKTGLLRVGKGGTIDYAAEYCRAAHKVYGLSLEIRGIRLNMKVLSRKPARAEKISDNKENVVAPNGNL